MKQGQLISGMHAQTVNNAPNGTRFVAYTPAAD